MSETARTVTLTLTDSESFVVYTALIAAKDAAILGLESKSEAQRSMSALRLVAVEKAIRNLVAASAASVAAPGRKVRAA